MLAHTKNEEVESGNSKSSHKPLTICFREEIETQGGAFFRFLQIHFTAVFDGVKSNILHCNLGPIYLRILKAQSPLETRETKLPTRSPIRRELLAT